MDARFLWILGSGLLMSAIALVGGSVMLLRPEAFKRLILPLVALSAGSLLGGALFHMIPAALDRDGASSISVFGWVSAGFTAFLALEQFLHHHHCHQPASDCKKPLGYLVLLGDGLHNLLGGLAIAGTFLIDVRLGIATWLAAAAHEIPQELGDFGVLVYSGWSQKKALLLNFLSALMFPLGGVLSYYLSFKINIDFLVPFAAGNFVYIAASDLVPEVNKARRTGENLVHFLSFAAGLMLLVLIKVALDS